MNSVPSTKYVCLSVKRALLKVAPEPIKCPFLQTVESFWTLLSKDKFPKLKDFAQKMPSTFGSVRVAYIFYTMKQFKSMNRNRMKDETVNDSLRPTSCYH